MCRSDPHVAGPVVQGGPAAEERLGARVVCAAELPPLHRGRARLLPRLHLLALRPNSL